jgi:predicted membrane-bound spermidine synthase
MSAPSIPSSPSITAEPGAGARSTTVILLGLTLLSGMAGLVHELLYLRILSGVLGELFYVHTALVAVFLLAMGVGALVAHRCVRWLFAVELALGLHALAFPAIVAAFQGSFLDTMVEAPGLHAVMVALILLAWPAACVGLSIPCFSACLAPRLGGAAFARTYVVFNVGAALSLLVVEYGLVRWVGYSRALAIVGSLNLVVGLALLVGRRRLLPPHAEPPAGRLEPRIAGAVFLASGFSGVFTAAFLKLCYALFRPNRENFALCTAALLLALAAGTSIVEERRWSFARCMSLAALALCGTWAFVPVVGTFYDVLPQAIVLYGDGALGAALRSPVGVVGVRLAFATLLGGSVYALVSGTLPALMRGEMATARRSGQLLLVSGIANALGLLLFNFLLHPSLPFFGVVAVTAGGFMLAALAMQAPLARLERRALAGALLLLPVLGLLPESVVYTSFRPYANATVSVFKSGPDDTTLVQMDGSSRIHYNGLPEISVGNPTRVNTAEITVGLIPALLAPRRERALVLGLGSGITAGTVASLCEKTDVVDVNLAALRLADALSFANFDVLENPGFVFHNQDGRRFLARPRDVRYDLIVNTVSTPKFYAAAKVYTVEFFDSVRRSLATDGVYATWFSPSDTSPEGARILLAGLASRFAHCALATVRGSYYVAACSDRPLDAKLSPSVVPAAVSDMLLRSARVPVSLDGYLDGVLLTRDLFARKPFGDGTPLNHDDFPRLEFYLRDLPNTALRDPVMEQPALFNIDTKVDPAAPGFVERAIVLYAHNRPFFSRYIERPLMASPEQREAFQKRLDLPLLKQEDLGAQVDSHPAGN